MLACQLIVWQRHSLGQHFLFCEFTLAKKWVTAVPTPRCFVSLDL